MENKELEKRTDEVATDESEAAYVEAPKPKKRTPWVILLLLHAAVCFYTVSGIAAKMASAYSFLSWGFILCYGGEILVLGIYAIVWQQIIKRVDISVAYANRSVAVFWSMLWAFLFFQEQITVQNIIGAALIFVGTWVVNRDA